jgi:hypothetical protein
VNTRGNSTRTAALIVAAVLVFFAVLGGGTWLVLRGTLFRPVALPEPPKQLPSPWPEPGAEAVREVPAMVRDVGEGIVNAITTPGPSLPADSAENAMPAREAGPVPGSGIVDAAAPIIAWQLCSALSQSTGRPLEEFVPKHDGECEYRRDKEFGVQAASRTRLATSLPDTIGGRPAFVQNPSVTIQLTDGSPQQVRLSWLSPRKPDAELRAWAESLVPRLLGT